MPRPFPILAISLAYCVVSIASVELVTYATDTEHEDLALLQRSAHWNGWSAVHVVGTEEGFQQHGLVDKLRALRRFTRKWPDNTILAFVDGYDVIINNEPSALETAFLASDKRVILASEVGCCTDKQTAQTFHNGCHRSWPFTHLSSPTTRVWPNSGVIVGYARDIRRLLRLAWKEYRTDPVMYRAYTDQQLLCFLVSDGSTIWTRASVGIDHLSELALTTYKTDIRIGQILGFDPIGRIVFANRTIPAIIHFNGPPPEKRAQMDYAKVYFPQLGAMAQENQ